MLTDNAFKFVVAVFNRIRAAHDCVFSLELVKLNLAILLITPDNSNRIYEACKAGMKVLYANATKLMGSLKIAKNKGILDTELKKLEKTQLLILDDLFLVPLDAKERAHLMEINEDRHGRKSIIITSQLPVADWYEAIGDPTVADAILDLIVHTAHRIELTGESVRKIKAAKRK